jgi:hypothetical protein
MANVEAQGMKCFAVHLGKDGATNANMVNVYKKMQTVKPAAVQPQSLPPDGRSIDATGVYEVGRTMLTYP